MAFDWLLRLKRSASALYRRIFGLSEWDGDPAVPMFAGAVFLGYAIRYGMMQQAGNGAMMRPCPPILQSCQSWSFLLAPPAGYSLNILYMGLLGVMVGGTVALYLRRWTWAHLSLLTLFLSRLFFMSVDYDIKQNYDYYAIMFSAVLLFVPHKRFFGQLSIVMFYFISTNSKLSASWTLGELFSTLNIGLPIFPAGTELVWTNALILMEMVGAWYLFSANRIVQRSMLVLYEAFHLYSGLLVGYLYPLTVMPSVLILFGIYHRPFTKAWFVPRDRRSWAGWAAMACLLVVQNIGNVIPGDQRLTMEGNFYGLFMFEGSHQCIIRTTVAGRSNTQEIFDSWYRCDPYDAFANLKQTSCRAGLHSGLQIDHSLNGSAFRRIVDEPDVCGLSYNPFWRNAWIKDETSAPEAGFPIKNVYASKPIKGPPGLAVGTGPVQHGRLHDAVAPLGDWLVRFWWWLHWATIAYLAYRFVIRSAPRAVAQS